MRHDRATDQLRGDARMCAAMVRAIQQLKELQPPCALAHHHGLATRIITVAGEPRAVCTACAEAATLDRRVARQREQRAAMRRA